MPHAPAFWYQQQPTWQARLLQPLSYVYGTLAAYSGGQKERRKYFAGVPVISIGNLSLGGTGKTPVVQWLAGCFTARGYQVAIVSRGYGGALNGYPTLVDAARHSARQVGDEPLMLARAFARQPVSVWVCRNRAAAVRRAEQSGATLILLDDGFQRRDVARTADILVIDGSAGADGESRAFGNGLPLPAGPLREFLPARARATFAIVLNAPQTASNTFYGVRAYRLGTVLNPAALRALKGPSGATPRVLAFAGIGHPQKFFSALTAAGIDPVDTAAFPDHHHYRPADLTRLQTRANAQRAQLVTTAKDAAKLPPGFAHIIPQSLTGPDGPAILDELFALI